MRFPAMRWTLPLALAATALAGCSGGPDARLPGVFTDAAIHDEFSCSPLLGPQGCPIVRFPEVHSGCDPEVPGYVVCNGTVEWDASVAAAAPGTRLVAELNGTGVGACEAPCRLTGNASFVHHFDGAGERQPWNVSVLARLDVSGSAPGAGGFFRLTAEFVVRTEPPGSLSA